MPIIDTTPVTLDQESKPQTTSEYEDSGEDILVKSETEEINDLAEALAFLLDLDTEPPATTTLTNIAAIVRPMELILG